MKKIKKALLSGRSLKVSYTDTSNIAAGEITDDISVKCGALVHDDLLNALDRLKIHFAILCDLREISGFPEQLNPDAFNNSDYLGNVYITGIQLNGEGESESLSIVGGKTFKGRSINIESPKCRRDSSYEYIEHLFEVMDNVNYEIEQYLFEGKYAIKQGELDFDSEAEEYQTQASESEVEEKPNKAAKKRTQKLSSATVTPAVS